MWAGGGWWLRGGWRGLGATRCCATPHSCLNLAYWSGNVDHLYRGSPVPAARRRRRCRLIIYIRNHGATGNCDIAERGRAHANVENDHDFQETRGE